MHNFSLSRPWLQSVFVCCGVIAHTAGLRAAESLPPFPEVYEVLKQNLPDLTPAELNRAAVTGLLEQLRGRVRLEGSEVGAGGSGVATNAPGLGAKVLERKFGYVRLGVINPAVAREFDGALKSLTATNPLKGLVLDLRFAGGADYSAAIALADRFLALEKPLADWGEGWKKSTAKTDAFTQPVTVLVNARTTGAAEALAGMLRFRDVALLVGTNTAGDASRTQLVPLKSGQQLRVAVAPLKVADGTELPRSGLKPDIAVVASSADELTWLADPYKVLSQPATNQLAADVQSSETNRSPRRRMNEAELVRMSRDGQTNEREPTVAPTVTPEMTVPTLQDVALSRALDVLKGLAVVQQFRAP